MSDTDFPCRADIRTRDQLRQCAQQLLLCESPPAFRENLLGLAWLYHTAALFGLNPDVFLQNLEPEATPYMAGLVRNFLGRPANEKTMDKWGMYVADSEKGKYIELRA
ncbi:MAG TPA: hypothetical protein VH253_18395 [Phycisphaerae bacterium]|nr:hypothetical protein [Phycisphaerae bacterium]